MSGSDELAGIALHEAAHGIAALALGARVTRLSIVPRAALGGRLADAGHVDRPWTGDLQLERVVALAGPAADAVNDGRGRLTFAEAERAYPCDGPGGDYDLARRACRSRPEQLERAWREAVELVARHWPAVRSLAEALLQRREVSGAHAAELLARGARQPKKVERVGGLFIVGY